MNNVVAISKVQSNYKNTIPKEIIKNYNIDMKNLLTFNKQSNECPPKVNILI